MTTVLCCMAFFLGVSFDAFLQCALAGKSKPRNRIARPRPCKLASRPFRCADGLWHQCLVVDQGGNTDFEVCRALAQSYMRVLKIVEAEENIKCKGK